EPATGSPGRALLVSAEDDLEDVIPERLERAGANMKNVVLLHQNRDPDRPLVFPEDWNTVAELIHVTNTRLVIIDPLMSFFSDRIDSHKAAETYRMFRRAAVTANEAGATIVFVRHLNKANGVGRAIYRGSGSIGIIGAARIGLLAALHPADSSKGAVLAVAKSNYGDIPCSLHYRILPEGALVEWVDPVGYSADELVVLRESKQGKQIARAWDFLDRLLQDHEWHGVDEIMTAAAA